MDTLEQFLDKFQSAVDFQEPVAVMGNTELASLAEWDSLAALGVIVMSDMEYGVTLTGNDLKTCMTVGDIHALVASRKG
jgi:acyl carrier protein